MTTLVYFLSSFCDLLVEDFWVPEWIKLLVGCSMPGVAIKRAIATIASLEKVQLGLTLESMVDQVDNYRFSSSLAALLFSGVAFSAIGLTIESMRLSKGKSKKQPISSVSSVPNRET